MGEEGWLLVKNREKKASTRVSKEGEGPERAKGKKATVSGKREKERKGKK